MSIGALFDEIPVDAFKNAREKQYSVINQPIWSNQFLRKSCSIFASNMKLMSHQRVKATMIVCHVPQLFFIFYTLVAEDRVIGATTFIY